MSTKHIITLTGSQIKELYQMLDLDIDDSQLDYEISIGEDKETGEGYFAWYSDFPEEGAINL